MPVIACDPAATPDTNGRDIAIIGTSMRLPGANSLDELWALVLSGETRFSAFPPQRVVHPDDAPDDRFDGAFTADADAFDASFFGIPPREATAMDPQQRWLLESAWHAFEDAGYADRRLSGSDTAVLVGISSFDYYELLLRTPLAHKPQVGTGVSHALVANRLSQFFNLKGTSEAIDTACSSSLVALWRAVELLRRGESRLALVGGVNLLASRTPFRIFTAAGMLSQQGNCLPFDDGACGYVRGEGAACVVLKSADAAREDGDRIIAIIKGGAVRHAGRTQSLTAPNPAAQAEVIAGALKDAAIDPAQVGYVEAHGTGTALGDPIEARGLKQGFARARAEAPDGAPCAPHFFVGTIKAQIGHLEAAAGLAGLLKTVAALHHRTIPGSPHLTRLNRHISLSDAPFRIPTVALSWAGEPDDVRFGEGKRYAGVSSFGFGGTNAHVVLGCAPADPARAEVPKQPRLFLLSARNPAALTALCERLAQRLASLATDDESQEQLYLQDVAFSLLRGRTALECRLAVIATSAPELIDALRRYAQDRSVSSQVFAGQHRRQGARVPDETVADPGAPDIDPGDLAALAAAWTGDAAIDLDRLLPRGSARFVALPPYPFSRDRFWVPSRGGETTTAAAFYTADWQPAPLDHADAAPPGGATVALVSGPFGEVLADALRQRCAGQMLRTVMCATAPEPGQGLENLLRGTGAPVVAVFDLTACDPDGYSQTPVPQKLELLRRVIGGSLKKAQPIGVIQATFGLQDVGSAGPPPVSLAGAQDAGLYASLGAEYAQCGSKTVDLAISERDPGRLADVMIREMSQQGGPTCIAYIGARRFVRTMRRIEPPVGGDRGGDSTGPVLITGGTGAIGLQLAGDLVQRGCRALMLTGRRALDPDKQAVVNGWRSRGAAVVLYSGSLIEAETLAAAVGRFRLAHGRIARVFHCAGHADTGTPAFLRKTATSIEAVMAPKVQALKVLHTIFADDPPDDFILFSSISASAPGLAAGLLDYAAANHFLDLFAHRQHAAGRRYYRSIQWTRWQDTGLAKGSADRPDGIGKALPAATCLEVLQALLRAGDIVPPSLCVAADGDPVFTTPGPSPVHRVPESAPSVEPAPAAAEPSPAHLDHLRSRVRQMLAEELERPGDELDDSAAFEDLGVDSVVLIGLIGSLETWLGRTVDPQTLIRCNSISAIARYLASIGATVGTVPPQVASPAAAEPANGQANPQVHGQAAFKVAVIGVACRLPGAADKDAFWRNLADGIDSVSLVPPQRWDTGALYAARQQPGLIISQWGGFIDGLDYIAPKLFGMTAADAADVDPLVRLFTECGLQAVTDTQFGREGIRGRRVGVFAGARSGGYAERISQPGKHSVTGVGQNFVSAHLSHLLDLRGPSMVTDCACSSSLAAIHLACQSLRTGDCELALAGGVEVLLDEKAYLFLSASYALSPDGRCRPFSAMANGFVPGEGVGCVVLKPLTQALADADPIYAVIDGSAINNDGHTLGVTTPGLDGQVDVIRRALSNAGASAHDISYVEAHGTGTLIGDPIELQALARAFADDAPVQCGIGSVKSNIGHLLSAAGIAGFIKVALSLHHRMLPPTLHFEPINPRFEFERTPFRPVGKARPWEAESAALKAGISAFGFGKTNVHMILSERPGGALRPGDSVITDASKQDGERIRAWHPPRGQKPAKRAALALLALESVDFEEMAIDTGELA